MVEVKRLANQVSDIEGRVASILRNLDTENQGLSEASVRQLEALLEEVRQQLRAVVEQIA